MDTSLFAPGGYRFIPAYFQYSSGVAAAPGNGIERVQLKVPVPLARGFEIAAQHMRHAGRPLTAFCACELRSPGQFTDAGFKAFNELYCRTLSDWGIYDASTQINPVARSNVAPEIGGPAEPCLYAFSYTVAGGSPSASFVIAGSAESKPGTGPYPERIVRYGDTSPQALREKAGHVLGVMEARLAAFGLRWADTTASQVYTIHDLHPFLADAIVARGAAQAGLTWHFARPPVEGLELEMDCRGVAHERVA
ncbi:MAG: hypothetical protein NW223_20585 [Hyphomicrobiaceae bacterium]|nr:hypothetical protein [Hyphomicrobiaceae bacterium]